ncbi:unnamed protein product [Sphagnum troendelagicum]|uniref:NAD(P)-binding protein n=1 Tax=Sphagnum troendelagicum TaxID=128251 RepID=A0ABP0UBJ2_9BRYO
MLWVVVIPVISAASLLMLVLGYRFQGSCCKKEHFVTLVSRSGSNLEEAKTSLVKELHCGSDQILTKVADVGDYATIARAIREAVAWRPIDVLICNAGRGQCGYFEDIPSQDVNTLVQTNLLGSLYAVHAALPFLKQQSSSNHPVSIVIMGSLASLVPLYANSVYTSTKYALKGLAESLKLELIPFGIRVTLLCPGFVDTPLADEITPNSNPELLEGFKLAVVVQSQSADEVAEISIAGIKSGSFLITTTPVVGPLLRIVSQGLTSDESFVKNVLEAIAYFPLRMLFFWSGKSLQKQLVAIHQKYRTLQ